MEETMDKALNDINAVREELSQISQCFKQFDNKLEGLKNEVGEGLKKTMNELVAKHVDDQIGKMTTKPAWNEIVAKQVDDQIGKMTLGISSVQKTIDETRLKALEERDRESRVNNIIIYKVPESKSSSISDRIQEDKMFCEGLLRDGIKVGYEENDIAKIIRLGKYENGKVRPLLLELNNRMIKNLIMENVVKLREASEIYKGISITHDMTKTERQLCKQLVKEAREKQEIDGQGEWVYRVRGPPGQLKIVQYKKRQ